MSIKATFPAGVTDITVNGLHQWDYGQKLEIHADDLPALIEVHFAYAGARDAIVRVCSMTVGVGEVTIPDQCLEQTSPVLAWIYVVDGDAGATVKTIVLPIIARTQPQPSPSEPESFTNRYTQLISEVNGLVDSLKEGNTTVAKAVQADKATKADSATTARSADSADTASTADYATEAGLLNSEWEHVNNGNSVTLHGGVALPTFTLQVNGVYIFSIQDNTSTATCNVVFAYTSDYYCNSSSANILLTLRNVEKNAEVWLSYNNGRMFLQAFDRADPLSPISDNFSVTVSYKRLA